MNDTLDKVRRELLAKEEDEGKKKLINGTRYLLFANEEKMMDEKGIKSSKKHLQSTNLSHKPTTSRKT